MSDYIHMSVKLNNYKFYTLIIYIPTYISRKMDLNKIEDEIHFLLECPSTSMDRQVLELIW
jgi:hypothetical protein